MPTDTTNVWGYIETEPPVKSGVYVIKIPPRKTPRSVFFDAMSGSYYDNKGMDITIKVQRIANVRYKLGDEGDVEQYKLDFFDELDRRSALGIKMVEAVEKFQPRKKAVEDLDIKPPKKTTCKGCYYWRAVSSSRTEFCCHYMLLNDEPRGCPINHCTRRVENTPENEKMLDNKFVFRTQIVIR